jgi:hypothetical protein
MSKFFIPTNSPEDWKPLLAEPEKHWKTGYSAKSLACCWQQANDFPACVKRVFKNSNISLFRNIKLLAAFPEYKVSLPGGRRASQNDIFIIASGDNRLVSITVEGKVSEPFGETVDNWKLKYGKGKEKRLNFLCSTLGLNTNQMGPIRYQLIHRTVSAMLEAERFCAKDALMLVHSFSPDNLGIGDYVNFLNLFEKQGEVNSLVFGKTIHGIDLYFAWVNSGVSFNM